MQVVLTDIPSIAHEPINSKLQRVWNILKSNKDNGAFLPSRYPGGFNVIVECDLAGDLTPTKIRGQIGMKYYSISFNYSKNEISVKYTEYADKTLYFSNTLHDTSHVNNRGRVRVTEWCTRKTHNTKRQIPREDIKHTEELLDSIAFNLTRLFKCKDFDNVV